MDLPKIKFIEMPSPMEIDLMHDFLFQSEWGWGKYIIRKHPKIKGVFSLKTEGEQVEFLKNYIIEFKKDNQKRLKTNKANYRKKWIKIEKDFLITLSEIMQIKWPKDRKAITAMLSANPICPRFLNSWSFSFFYDYKKTSHALEVIMHESCHFLYFEKWKQVYPKINPKKFESPYIEWHLSEIIAPIILNDRRIQKLLKQRAVFYTEHQKIKINGKPALKLFSDLYKKDLAKKDGFEKFLKDSYSMIKKNKKLFDF